MKRLTLPGTDLTVSRLSFGTASLHHLPTSWGRQALLAEAMALGFSHFDTSPYYGFGIAEHELGLLLRGGRSEISVATKVGLYPPGGRTMLGVVAWSRKAAGRWIPALSRAVVDWSVRAAEKSLEESLRVLGRDRVDVLLLHEAVPGVLASDDYLRWLMRQREAGKIRHWGLAGPLPLFVAWAHHPLADVLQVRDEDVRGVIDAGREPQLSYGALASAHEGGPVSVAIRTALERNPSGSLIVSTRKVEHLRELARMLE